MVDDERLKQLRALGAKAVAFARVPATGEAEITHIEFFPTISPLDMDTLVPSPSATSEGEGEKPPLPDAFARILKRGSVS
jgi:hypothetical protein